MSSLGSSSAPAIAHPALARRLGDVALAAWVGGTAAGYAVLPLGPRAILPLLATAAAVAALAGSARLTFGEESGGPAMTAVGLCLALGAGGAAWGAAHRHLPGPDTIDGYLGRGVTVNATVASTSPRAGGGDRLRLDVRQMEGRWGARPVRGAMLADTAFPTLLEAGDEVIASGRLAALRRVGPDGREGYDQHLERQGVYAAMPGATIQLRVPGGWSAGVAALRLRRAAVAEIARRFPQPEASVLTGLLLGSPPRLPRDAAADLQDSGLIHLLAISGLKVAITVGVLESVLARVAGRRAALAAILGAAIYVAVGGGGASGLRAALMGGLAMVGRALGRDVDPTRSLLLAAATLLAWRPGLAADLGFQFSFLGVLGIRLLAPRLEALLPKALPGPVRQAAAVTAGAQTLTLPLTAHYFQVIPMLAPLANGLAVPLVPATMLSGSVATLAGTAAEHLPDPAGAAATAVAAIGGALTLALVRAILVIAHLIAMLPLAIHIPAWGAATAGAYWCGLALAVTGDWRGWRPAVWAPVAGAVALAVLAVSARPDGRLHLTFIGGVSGPAVLVRAPDGAVLLVDGGTSAAALAPALDSALPAGWSLPGLDRRLDAALLTGSTLAEAGAAGALDSYRVSLIVIPAADDGDAAVRAADSSRTRGAEVAQLAPGQRLAWHGLSVGMIAGGPVELVELRWRGDAFLIGGGGTTRDPAQPPYGRWVAIDLGAHAPDPTSGPAAGWLVLQDAGARVSGRLPALSGVGRVWRTSTDGTLELVCDPAGCHEEGSR